MAGPRSRFRYTFSNGSGSAKAVCFIDCDSDAPGTVVGGVTNSLSPLPNTGDRYNFQIPVINGKLGNSVRSRVALLKYTSTLPPGRAGRLIWVPVLRPSTFNSWVVGQTGTHKSLPIILLRKVDGSPDVRGL